MPRPRKHRQCRHHQGDRIFKPRSIPLMELEVLTLADDELEALRLCDMEGFDQESAGNRMGVSRGTVQRLLKSARATLVKAIVENSAVFIGSRDSGLDSEPRRTRKKGSRERPASPSRKGALCS